MRYFSVGTMIDVFIKTTMFIHCNDEVEAGEIYIKERKPSWCKNYGFKFERRFTDIDDERLCIISGLDIEHEIYIEEITEEEYLDIILK